MNNNLSINFVADQPANEVFNAICSISKWWTENVKGNSQKLDDEFTVQFGDMHFSKQKLIEVVPNERVVWLVTDSKLSWLANEQEWTGTRIVFEISSHGQGTQLHLTHIGLSPDIECYEGCSTAWRKYIGASLFNLITTGQGQPQLRQLETKLTS